MKRELSRGITSRKRFAGKSDFSAKHVSTTLLLLLLCMLMPQGVKAKEFNYPFADLAAAYSDATDNFFGNYPLTLSSTSYPSGAITHGFYGVSTTYGSVTVDFSKFAFRSECNATNQGKGWYLCNSNRSVYVGCGLFVGNGTPEFAITNLKNGDVIEVSFRGAADKVVSLGFVSGNAEQNGSALTNGAVLGTSTANNITTITFTSTSKGDIIIKANGTSDGTVKYTTYLTNIKITRSDVASYNFDPAIEIYNLSNGSGSLSIYDKAAPDFQLNGANTGYLYSSYLALNNRIAVNSNSTDGWSWENGGLRNTSSNIMNLAISNLEEGDRVVITYQDGSTEYWKGLYFGSTTGVGSTELNSEAFKDINNNGELDEDEDEEAIKRDDRVESEAVYTMTHDGHLDFVVFPGAIITKIEIYADHRALIECRDNGIVNGKYMGNTMYFTGTGQIKEKTYIMPGGLIVQFGNDDETEHTYISATVEGPASYINDYQGFKMARNNSNTIFKEAPTTGTYYRFIPEVDGTIHFRFKAQSIRYNPYSWNNGTGIYWNPSNYNVLECEEIASSGEECPYALFEDDGSSYTKKWWTGTFSVLRQNNGNWEEQMYGEGGKASEALVTVNNDLKVKAGNIYYLYGNWNGDFSQGAYCGVARLMDVTFIPDGYVQPLAKVIDNKSTSDGNLAIVTGYTNPSVKKYLGNIVYAEPYIDGNTLKIKNIQYKADSDRGGVVLIKFDNAEEPIFALTVAYDAGWNTNKYGNSEGHTWDFSSKSLAIGRYADQNSTLYKEANEAIPDWTFAYRVGGDKNWDPMYLNAYNMEGDNADMIEETEGLWFKTGSNQSCLYNEFAGDNIHVSEGADPDRYVGIMPGGSFTIPKLKQYDRVYIYMGSGTGSSTNGIFLNITNALDAVGTPINSEYRAGGSLWNVRTESNGNHHNDPYYRGCYHFIAAEDGDMTFEMVGGSMCKIYQITIHRGDHYDTTEMNRNNNSGVGFFNEEGATTGAGGSYTIHYRGKGESIGAPEVLTWSGNLSAESFSSTYLIGDKNNVSFTSRVGDFGAFRMRLKDMDYTGNYVCDFCDRNFTVGYKEKVSYPCTWDFTDIMTYSGSDITAEAAIPDSESPVENKGWDLSLWDEEGNMIVRHYDESVAVPDVDTYKNGFEVFSQNKNGQGNQLYANDKIIPETKGLWFYMDNNDHAYNGSMKIAADGLHLANKKVLKEDNSNLTMGWWNYKMVVPNVPNGAAVYLRMKRDPSVGDGDYSKKPDEAPVYFLSTKFHFGTDTKTDLTPINNGTATYPEVINSGNYSFYKVAGSTDEWILAVKNNKGAASNLTFTLNGWILEKMAISEDAKTVNRLGWATESRARVIDPALTSELTGYPFETYIVTGASYANKTVTLSPVTVSSFVMPIAEDGDNNAYIIRNTLLDKERKEDDVPAPGRVQILNNGFHLFVPDMHDYQAANDVEGNTLNQKKKNEMGSNMLVSLLTSQTLNKQGDGNVYNYALTSQKNKVGDDTQTYLDEIGFYRIKDRTKTSGNQGYLPVDCTVPTGTTDGGGAKMSIIFDSFDDPAETVETAIEVPFEKVFGGSEAVYYNLNGQKLSGKPTQGGLYIVNGKKVLVK